MNIQTCGSRDAMCIYSFKATTAEKQTMALTQFHLQQKHANEVYLYQCWVCHLLYYLTLELQWIVNSVLDRKWTGIYFSEQLIMSVIHQVLYCSSFLMWSSLCLESKPIISEVDTANHISNRPVALSAFPTIHYTVHQVVSNFLIEMYHVKLLGKKTDLL